MKVQEHIEKLEAEINDLIQQAFRERMQNKSTKRFRAICKCIDELEQELEVLERVQASCCVPIIKGFVSDDPSETTKSRNVDAFEKEDQCLTES